MYETLEFVTVFRLADVFVTTDTSTLLHSNGTIFGYPSRPLQYALMYAYYIRISIHTVQ
jgi:hypothetical protein